MGDFSIRLAGLESAYLPRKIKVQPDLNLVRDKFSVRHEG